MTIKKLKDLLSTSDHPIERVLHDNHCVKVSIVGFENGMMLRERQAEAPTKIMVLSGIVKYFEVDKKITLNQYDEFDIPTDVTHYIVADERSLCLLTQDRLNQNN